MITCANPHAQFKAYQEEIEAAVLAVIRGTRYILGGEVEALEKEFASYIGTSYAIGVANGTDAIELALRAFGIGVDDEVITVSHTAVATVAAIEAAGALPVLIDIEPNHYTLNVSQLPDLLTVRTKAVIAVHLYGQSSDIEEIQKFCKQNNLIFIEDVSQAHGATWRGKKLGSFGDVACFSCYPTKNLGAIGDAGLITTNNKNVADKLYGLRAYGWAKSHYISDYAGRNSRLDEVQAAILRVKLKYLDQSNSARQRIADYYESNLLNLDDFSLPKNRMGAMHVYHLYVVQVSKRDELYQYMHSKGVMVGIHYPSPVHLQPAYYSRIRHHKDMFFTEEASKKILSLPMYPELKIEDQINIIQLIGEFYKKNHSR